MISRSPFTYLQPSLLVYNARALLLKLFVICEKLEKSVAGRALGLTWQVMDKDFKRDG